jgi:hypothetical protein
MAVTPARVGRGGAVVVLLAVVPVQRLLVLTAVGPVRLEGPCPERMPRVSTPTAGVVVGFPLVIFLLNRAVSSVPRFSPSHDRIPNVLWITHIGRTMVREGLQIWV